MIKRRATIHCHGVVDLERRHSVGHLKRGLLYYKIREKDRTNLVQVPAARGKVMPDMDSINDDFPALWLPITAIWGRSMSTCTLVHKKVSESRPRHENKRTYPVLCKRLTRSSILRRPLLNWGSERPTPSLGESIGEVGDGESGFCLTKAVSSPECMIIQIFKL